MFVKTADDFALALSLARASGANEFRLTLAENSPPAKQSDLMNKENAGGDKNKKDKKKKQKKKKGSKNGKKDPKERVATTSPARSSPRIPPVSGGRARSPSLSKKKQVSHDERIAEAVRKLARIPTDDSLLIDAQGNADMTDLSSHLLQRALSVSDLPNQLAKIGRKILVASFADDPLQHQLHLVPGGTAMKSWQLRNDGASRWKKCRVVYVGGKPDAKGEHTPLGPTVDLVDPKKVKPGAIVSVSVIVHAPQRPGSYLGFWRLCDRAGQRFGPRLWVDVRVVSSETPALPTAVTKPLSVFAKI